MNKKLFVLFLGLLLLWACGGKTVLVVKSNPTQADFILKELREAGTTDTKIVITKEAFGKSKSIKETATFRKEGFWPEIITFQIIKNKANDILAVLKALDTNLTITSTPPGALVQLSSPILNKTEFTTPYTFQMPAFLATALSGNVSFNRIFLEGYLADALWRNRAINIPPRENTTINIPLMPIQTTLRVFTEPEGATVEDIEESGFGYLGTTPLARVFTYEDIKKWASKRRVVRKQGQEPILQDLAGFDAIEITLRISKSGYDDTFFRNTKIPIGEERSFQRILKPKATQIRFNSDPAGAHVFVIRFTEKEIYDENTGQLRRERVGEEKYLGTTPFAYNIDKSDPLIHGERLIFRISSVPQDTIIRYSEGQSTYFVVLR